MGKDFFENSVIAKDMIRKASDRLGFSFEDLLFNESENLGKTEFTQPCNFIGKLYCSCYF